ncbi:crossover junction endodeoxyribonuclease RuvC [Gordonia sp. PDNC005]|uniref:crossover junction endodeoxyribonuclease RuvC n=1 Tax=Gordonia sp. PDNC005 TaxID=2811424 RepID=UPI001965EE3A|nr:crossover junction endodeoxyribonuclease RuvC [Gordonia sp. PDNC005]QRY62715.1 crossover junction endodeoxyribonuclease RuvC [Gordonia sp. PDNC005]
MTALTVTGLDLSLTGTGIAHIRIDRPPTVDPQTTVETLTITSTGRRADTLPQRVARIRKLRNAIVDQARTADLVVLEAPAFAANVGSVWDRAGLWHHVVAALDHLGVPYIDVAPTRVKKFAADKGNADKAAVAAGMARLWGERAAPADNNQFDALALASLGAIRVAGRQLPIRVLERHREVVAAIDWPTVPVTRRS